MFSRNGVTLHVGDCRDILASLEPESVHCCVTSPPYWGLRDYGVDGQLGRESTPEEYVESMVGVFREVKRVLRNDGTLWLNLGDSYSSSGIAGKISDKNTIKKQTEKAIKIEMGRAPTPPGCKPKDLVGIPWMIAFALRADGWYLRSEIIWHKPNPMPESVEDRPTKSHEQIFLLTKSARYFYDAEAIKDQVSGNSHPRGSGVHPKSATTGSGIKANESFSAAVKDLVANRNRRSVWTIPTKPYSGAHFAVFPPALIEPCILAGTSEEGCCPECGAPWERVVERTQYNPDVVEDGIRSVDDSRGDKTRKLSGREYNEQFSTRTTGWQPTCQCDAGKPTPCTVLDPFMGSGTTAEVAINNGCRCIGCELSPEYFKLATKRFKQHRLFTG